MDNKELLKNIPFIGSPKTAVENALIPAIIGSPFKVAQPSMMGDADKVYTTEECLRDVYDFVWKPTVQGKKLTELEMKLQREFLSSVCGGAGLRYEGAGAEPVSLAGTHIEMPDFVSGYARKMNSLCYKESCPHCGSSPVAGYEPPHYQFINPPMVSHECYPYILKVQKLIKSRISSSSGEQKAHYELILRNIEKTLK